MVREITTAELVVVIYIFKVLLYDLNEEISVLYFKYILQNKN